MGGKGSGISRKLSKLPSKPVPGWRTKLDNRFLAARFANNRYAAITSDLGSVETMSTLSLSMVERYVFCEFRINQIETEAMKGKAIDIDAYLSLVGVCVRIAALLGLERKAKPVEDLHDYMKRVAAESTGGPSEP